MMHIYRDRPACYTTGEPTPRAAWSHDQGRGCGNAADPDVWRRNMITTPGCDGCSRAEYALKQFMEAKE